jgi:hypothetical protein
MNLFKRNHEPNDDAEIDLISLPDARPFVPSSAKSPEAQRLNVFNPDDEIDEAADEDLAFLHSLVGDEARPEQSAKKAQRRQAVRPQIAAAKDEASAPPSRATDDLDVFREMAAMRQPAELARQFKIGDVDMGDLLEDLQTTRAALRHRRKAA